MHTHRTCTQIRFEWNGIHRRQDESFQKRNADKQKTIFYISYIRLNFKAEATFNRSIQPTGFDSIRIIN